MSGGKLGYVTGGKGKRLVHPDATPATYPQLVRVANRSAEVLTRGGSTNLSSGYQLRVLVVEPP